jgi:hypothetical protein
VALERAARRLGKLSAALSACDAAALLGRLAERRAAALCSIAQARQIARARIPTATLTFERARELCTILRDAGWRPQALYGTPEHQAARAVRAGRPEPRRAAREQRSRLWSCSGGAEYRPARIDAT